MTTLSINLNKIALLRNARGANFPKVMDFAELCIENGADGVTVHPRQDQRHATYQDVRDLAQFRNQNPSIELNIEGYPTSEFLEIVKAAKPDQCTLVPDAPDQVTSDHGWDTKAEIHFLRSIISELKENSIRTSLFLDPDLDMVPSAAETGTDRIELYTEEYAVTYGSSENDDVLEQYRITTKSAQEHGLGVNAGHDLNQRNLAKFLTIPEILEVSIGHAVTVEALLNGYARTIRAYADIVRSGRIQ